VPWRAFDDFKVWHVSPRVQAHGGIEALHARHRERLGVPQFSVALFDRARSAKRLCEFEFHRAHVTWPHAA